MDVLNIITTLISSVGFPITCCIIMFYQNGKLRDTIEANTKVLIEMKNELQKKE